MSKIVKASLVILAILPVLCNCGTLAADKQEADAQPKVENPYLGARVLVEALLVEAKLDALDKAGAGLLSKEQATAVKILDIIKDKNAGRILASEKLALVNFNSGIMQVSGRKEIPLKRDPNSVPANWTAYDTGTNFNANVEIDSSGRILLNFQIEIKILSPDSLQDNQRPEVLSFSWHSLVSMKSGTPVIASALENKDKVTYLIIRANIEEDSLPQAFQHKK
jgi:hypothetical protein